MDNEDYILGEQVMLSFNTLNGWMPVGCITTNGLERSRGRIETTGRGSGGNKSYRPTDKDYSISFEGLLSKSESLVSYNYLDQLFEGGTVFEWRMMSAEGWIVKTGTSFITALALGTAARQWVTFSCTLSPAKGGIEQEINYTIQAAGYIGVDEMIVKVTGLPLSVPVEITGYINLFETSTDYPFTVTVTPGGSTGSVAVPMPLNEEYLYTITDIDINPTSIGGKQINIIDEGVMIYPEIVLSARHEDGGTYGRVRLDAGDVQLSESITATGNIGLYVLGDPPETPPWDIIPFSVTMPKNTNSTEVPLPVFYANDSSAIPRIQDVVFTPSSVDGRHTKIIIDVELYEPLPAILLSGEWLNTTDSGEVTLYSPGATLSETIVASGDIKIHNITDDTDQTFPFSITLDEGDVVMLWPVSGAYADETDFEVTFENVVFTPPSVDGRETEVINPLTWV